MVSWLSGDFVFFKKYAIIQQYSGYAVIQKNIEIIRKKIADSCMSTGRQPDGVTLLAVTKTINACMIREAILAGVTDIGESRLQEAQAKFAELGGCLGGVRRHFIGHLQTNKAKKAVELFDVIQSLDSVRLAEELNAQAARINKIQECFVELKVSGEDTKFGVAPADAGEFIRSVGSFTNIRVSGLMAMAPYFDDEKSARPFFRIAHGVFEALRASHNLKTLSMGMSGDFEQALAEGATMVRIGTAIFGER